MSLAAIVTMVLMLVLLASLVIVLSGMQAGLDLVESKVEVRAELLEGVPRERVDALRQQVAALPEVESVSYVSKEEALAQFRSQLAEGQADLTEVVGSNPLPAQLVVKLRDPREFGAVRSVLEAPPGVVSRVMEQQTNVDRLISITGLLRTVGIIIIALVGLTVLLIVVNSIRMALMSRADEIEIMRLVGASDAFVRWPFIFEGLLVGILGAAITLGLLSLAAAPISQLATAIAGQVPVGFGDRLSSQVAAVVVAAGLGLGSLGAWLSVRAYLRS
ncbi:MAG: ABC transporter permease [Chloroflexota bacterium]|nr:ABC transporter permease [Chloroflexota bacterium]